MEIAFSGQVGSCPYLLSWDNERRDWTEHGKVLHQASDASREETQTIALPGLVSRFRLEEREPEVATIDNAEVAVNLNDGRSMTLRPDMAPAAKAGRQLLFWGDAQELEFSLPRGVAPADVVQSRLSLTGCRALFEPAELRLSRRGRVHSGRRVLDKRQPAACLGGRVDLSRLCHNCPQREHRLLAGQLHTSTVNYLLRTSRRPANFDLYPRDPQ